MRTKKFKREQKEVHKTQYKQIKSETFLKQNLKMAMLYIINFKKKNIDWLLCTLMLYTSV